MFRGTNPSICFRVKNEFDLEKIVEVWITLSTWDIEKTYKLSENQVSIDPIAKTIAISTTQEDTLGFEEGSVEIQMRLLDNEGFAYATDVKEIDMKKILKDGVIS